MVLLPRLRFKEILQKSLEKRDRGESHLEKLHIGTKSP